MEVQRNKIQLYCNQVFITDEVKNILPDFLTLLHGVVDSPDIPLNVSRSYLLTNSSAPENVKKIEVKKPRVINSTQPLWIQKPSELKDEDYKGFYNELYPMSFEEPLFHIHINVDYPFNLTGILFLPKLKNQMEVQRNKIQLYCNRVFITDEVKNILPDFLTLLHGVVDSPDIPLNVSRSYLQADGNVNQKTLLIMLVF